MATKTLTFALMDPPFENARTATAMRLMAIAAKRGYNVNVFAYEGSVFLPFAKQVQHANSVHGHTLEEENHPLTKDWVAALAKEPAPPPPAPASIELKLSTKPTDVQVEVDGLLVGHTPLALKGRDGDIVVVTLSAPGYVKMERKILLSRQLSELKLELEKARVAKPRPDTQDIKDPYPSLGDDPY